MVEFVCQNCGCKKLRDVNGNIVSDPKKIDVHVQHFCADCNEALSKDQLGALLTSTIQEDTYIRNLRNQARTAKNNESYEDALALYQQLQAIAPDAWDAEFYSVYCSAHEAVGAIENACTAMEMCLNNVFNKLETLEGIEKQNAVKFVVSDACSFALHMFDAAVRQHTALDANSMLKHNNVYKNQLTCALNIVITCANLVIRHFGNDNEVIANVELAAMCALQMQTRQQYVTLYVRPDTEKTLLEWVGRFNPGYVKEYKEKQKRAMRSGNIFLIIMTAVFYAIGHFSEGFWADFGIWMAIFCGAFAVLRIISQLFLKKK